MNDSTARLTDFAARVTMETKPPLTLVRALCDALAEESIDYCHWKSNDVLDRSACGDNDLDLLVRRGHLPRLVEILSRLRFKRAEAPPHGKMPGVLDFYGLDEGTGKLVHVHAHGQLIVGDDRTKSYRIPLERALLASASRGGLFRTPAAEIEFVVFVLRMILKHSTWDAILHRFSRLSAAERRELEHLGSSIRDDALQRVLVDDASFLDAGLFHDCVGALRPDAALWYRVRCGARLQRALRPCARRSHLADVALKAWRRLALALRRRLGLRPRTRLSSGGAMIAVVGGDGSGKTTLVEALYRWLARDFDVRLVHLGKPEWSWLTVAVRGTMKVGRFVGLDLDIGSSSDRYIVSEEARAFPGYPVLLREACMSRDRHLAYLRARRDANAGRLVICDRFPLPQIKLMDGPVIEQLVPPERRSRRVERLIERERGFYRAITRPEVLVVLLLDPELAVQRKTDETAVSVRARSGEVWRVDWSKESVEVVDASLPPDAVLARVRSLIWQLL
jgi:thymidylate kinase